MSCVCFNLISIGTACLSISKSRFDFTIAIYCRISSVATSILAALIQFQLELPASVLVGADLISRLQFIVGYFG